MKFARMIQECVWIQLFFLLILCMHITWNENVHLVCIQFTHIWWFSTCQVPCNGNHWTVSVADRKGLRHILFRSSKILGRTVTLWDRGTVRLHDRPLRWQLSNQTTAHTISNALKNNTYNRVNTHFARGPMPPGSANMFILFQVINHCVWFRVSWCFSILLFWIFFPHETFDFSSGNECHSHYMYLLAC